MINKSYQLIRTNPRLTTNYKIVVSSDYELYLESFNSSKVLSDNKYKHYLLSTTSMIENDLPKFYDKLPKNIAFSPKLNNDVEIMYNSYDNQYDNIYFSGADEIEDKWYAEEFEYLAPLYVVKNELPSNFIIMRVNDASVYNKDVDNYSIGNLTKNNFRSEIINKWKCINVFDLTPNTNFGKFLDRNINTNTSFPNYSLFFDIKKYNFTKFSGMGYTNGVYCTSELFMNDFLEKEKPHYEFEEFITKQYENLGIIYPYIFNFKFLFNDNPATPDKFLKYTMNRYYGFYTNKLELVKTITSYNLPKLKDNLIIKNNIFLDLNGNYINPFYSNTIINDWVQVGNDYYQIRKQINNSYKIISDKNLTGYDVSLFNNGIVTINNNLITDFGNIDEYINKDNNKELMYSDLYLIEIDGIYHVLRNNYIKNLDSNNIPTFINNYIIDTDYNITSNKDIIEYYKGGLNNKYYKQKTIIDTDKKPLFYKIYRVDFSDIKDFDFDRVNTSYSDFDYEKSEYVNTSEVKLYATEYRDINNPRKNKVHKENEDGQYKLMNISSEYIAGDELFQIKKGNKLNSLWEKNQSINKWSYVGSVSHSDYPYKLNNSYEIGGNYNRTTNTDMTSSNRIEKNLDYFYRIGEFYGKSDITHINGFGTPLDWSISIPNLINEVQISESSIIVDLTNSIQRTVNVTLNSIILEKNTDYYVSVNVDMNSGHTINSSYNVGFSTDVFDNATIYYSTNGKITLSFIGTSKSEKLKFIVDNFTYVKFDNLKVYKMVNKYYFNQSTNIQTELLTKSDNLSDNRFNLDYYINSDFDYFEYFFNNVMYYDNHGKLLKKPFTKYSVFNGGDNNLPSSSLFKGIEYKLYNVTDMVINDSVGNNQYISNIITDGGEKFNGYKLSVILSENYNYYKFKKSNIDTNIVKWSVINNNDYDYTSDIQLSYVTDENGDYITDENDNYILGDIINNNNTNTNITSNMSIDVPVTLTYSYTNNISYITTLLLSQPTNGSFDISWNTIN